MGEIVRYRSNGGQSEGYLARPPSGSGPGVIVIQEWWGLVPHITSLVDRFADAGFVALAPDLYHGQHTAEPDEAGKLMMGLAMDQAAKDMAGAAVFLTEQDYVSSDRVAAIGFCMGGSLALWSATLSDKITATIGFYPPVPWERMNPSWADYAGKSALIHCSEHDGTSAAPGIQLAKRSIEAAGGDCTLYDYPGTDHAFFNDDRPEVYNSTAAATAWARSLSFLRDHLG
jgi:carboxymethylenebutenolidase